MTPPFRRVLIANRGEIAIRVARACRELGIESVAVYSDADRDAPHVRAMDRAEWIGPTPAAESYLSVGAILEAARRSEAEAIHPGYGFLSESAAFARAVESVGLVFVGPPAETMEGLGNKLAARRTAVAAGVAVTPGLLVSAADARPSEVEDIGYPLLVKAAAGGGGRGVRRVDGPAELDAALDAARAEAVAAFDDGTVYIEKLVAPARHVEVQLLGDRAGGLAVLGERDCSIQRRHQKLVEEAPAPNLSAATRTGLADDARRIAQAVPFHNAATVEFLVDESEDRWFLEMNTRLQVEHGVTELVSGVDIVAWQLRVAAGEQLPPDVREPTSSGHAIQVRIYAEDPWVGFAPSAGTIMAWQMADGPGIRLDAGVEAGYELPTAYDPLLAKLLVHASDRPAAVTRLRRALDETVVSGMPTTLGFHRWLVDQPAFTDGRYDTGLVSNAWVDGPPLTARDRSLAAAAVAGARGELTEPRGDTDTRPAGLDRNGDRPWSRLARSEAVDRE
ncbi:MAG TPA: biotin carboxylase N-terminal domain-containing protein [Candidatus Limnocylindria bacterium]|nr:biotin carboxylase N-terminal domain-containing protein [Candidatus Limnocylindria bacterium]